MLEHKINSGASSKATNETKLEKMKLVEEQTEKEMEAIIIGLEPSTEGKREAKNLDELLEIFGESWSSSGSGLADDESLDSRGKLLKRSKSRRGGRRKKKVVQVDDQQAEQQPKEQC
jgi:recombinational DNA repair protein RecR